MPHDSFILKGKDPTIKQSIPCEQGLYDSGKEKLPFLKGRNLQKNQAHGGVGADEQDKT